MTAPTNPDAETTPSRAVVVSDACSRSYATPETDRVLYVAGSLTNDRAAALETLCRKLENERDREENLADLLADAVTDLRTRLAAMGQGGAAGKDALTMWRAARTLHSENVRSLATAKPLPADHGSHFGGGCIAPVLGVIRTTRGGRLVHLVRVKRSA